MSETLPNYIDMPIQQLDQRGKELSASINTINHTPERKAQIQREISSIAFEMWFRYQSEEFDFMEVA